MNKSLKKTIWIVSLFSIAMAFLESAVVIYLREIYYPNGFQFPLLKMDLDLAIVELFREAATLIMLITIAYLSGKKAIDRFAYFLLSFAIWDIFYYVFLKAFLFWPSSLFTWDVLFLLPTVWVGPVLAPIILASLMIVFAIIILKYNQTQTFPIVKKEWLMLISGSLIVIISFTLDYLHQILESPWYEASLEFSQTYIPQNFNWFLFMLGCMGIVYGISSYHFRTQKNKSFLKTAQLF